MAKLKYVVFIIICLIAGFFLKSINPHGLNAVLVCVFVGAFSSFVYYQSRRMSKFVSIPLSSIPALVILAYALIAQSVVYVLVSVIIFSIVIAELIYADYIVEIKIDDIGVMVPLVVCALFFINIGVISSNILLEFYSVILQAYLALLGIVFMLGIFIIEMRQWPNSGRFKRILIGFSSFFILVALLSLIGLLTTSSDVNLSHQVLFSQANVLFPNTLFAALLVGTVCLFMSSLAYLFVLFTIFLEESSGKNGKG